MANPELFDEARLAELGIDGVMRELAARVNCPDHPDNTSAQRVALAGGLDIVDRALLVHGPHERLGMLRSMLLGKLGRFDDAVANARALHARAPTWTTAVTLGNALRRAKDTPGAVDAFRAAAALDTTDVGALLDVGDLLIGMQRWGEAEAAYDEALEREPDHAWAVPSACYARYRATGEAAALDALRAMASAKMDECGVAGLLASVTGGYSSDQQIERARELLAGLEAKSEPTSKPKSKPAKRKPAAKAKAKQAPAKRAKPASAKPARGKAKGARKGRR